MEKLPTYIVKPGDSDIFAISLVDSPAVESDFKCFSKDNQIKFFANEEKRVIYGVALRADFPIYRNDGFEYYLVFTQEAVERLANKYMKHCYKSFTLDHMDFAPEGSLSIVEAWLVKDAENDKAKALGLENFGNGDFIIGVKVDDDETWKRIKEGRWKGFSVEAFISMDEINLSRQEMKKNTEVKMELEPNVWDKIKAIILDAIAGADGKEEEAQEEAADEAADKVEEVVEEVVEETVEKEDEFAEETPNAEEVVDEVVDTVEEKAETTEEAADELQKIIDGLKDELDALKAENEELKKENQKMSKQPSADKFNSKKPATDWRERLATVYQA